MAQLHVVLSDAEKAELRRRAFAAEMSVAAFVRSRLFAAVPEARSGMRSGGDVVMPDGKSAGEHMAEKRAAKPVVPLEKPPVTRMPAKAPVDRREVSPMFKGGGR